MKTGFLSCEDENFKEQIENVDLNNYTDNNFITLEKPLEIDPDYCPPLLGIESQRAPSNGPWLSIHNLLTGIQGGNASERYHLTREQWLNLGNSAGVKANQGLHITEDGFVQLGGSYEGSINISNLSGSTFLDLSDTQAMFIARGSSPANQASIVAHNIDDTLVNVDLRAGGFGGTSRAIIIDNSPTSTDSLLGIQLLDEITGRGAFYANDYSIGRTFPLDNNWIPNAKWALDTFALISDTGYIIASPETAQDNFILLGDGDLNTISIDYTSIGIINGSKATNIGSDYITIGDAGIGGYLNLVSTLSAGNDRLQTFQDKDGVIALLSDITGGGSSYIFNNGLTETEGVVGLGGDYIDPITIGAISGGGLFSLSKTSGFAVFSSGFLNAKTVGILAGVSSAGDYLILGNTNGRGFNISSDPTISTKFTDTLTNKGLYYYEDYSANWGVGDEEVLVTKRYVDSKINNNVGLFITEPGDEPVTGRGMLFQANKNTPYNNGMISFVYDGIIKPALEVSFGNGLITGVKLVANRHDNNNSTSLHLSAGSENTDSTSAVFNLVQDGEYKLARVSGGTPFLPDDFATKAYVDAQSGGGGTPIDLSDYARLDVANSFTGNQIVIGNIEANSYHKEANGDMLTWGGSKRAILYLDPNETVLNTTTGDSFFGIKINNTHKFRMMPETGNLILQDGGVFTENGNRLTVDGDTLLSGNLRLSALAGEASALGVDDSGNLIKIESSGGSVGLTKAYVQSLPLIDDTSGLSVLDNYAPYRTSSGFIKYKFPEVPF